MFAQNNVTEFFKDYELACPCCGDMDVTIKIQRILDHIRRGIGPFSPNSVKRCRKRNRLVNGKRNSAHLLGKAADIPCKNNEQRALIIERASTMGVRRMGIYKTFVHIDVADKYTGHPVPRYWIG